MVWNVLSASTNASSGTGAGDNGWSTWIMLGMFILVIVVFMVYNRRTQKKRQEETMNTLNAIKPGNKVKTIGGICGVVVEVCDDNTFVLETGTEKSGKSYMKFDKQAVYQTDATVPTATKPNAAVAPTEEKAEEKTETPVAQDQPVEAVEETVEETPVAEAEETPAKKTTRKKKAE